LITAGVLAGLTSVPALAGPQGEQVVHGSANFQRNGNQTTIKTTHRAIINYHSFNLGSAESVRFVQPNASSKVLNRIQSGMPSTLDGAIYANGNVYFVNPAGIYFGANAVVNVGGIFAAAGSISNEDFLNNVNRFTDLGGEVVNRGVINASSEVHLIGRRVANFGRIVSPEGLITMTAGDDVLLGKRDGRVFARITGDAGANGATGVENHGSVDAGSGRVIAGVGDHFALALFDSSSIRGGSVSVAGGANSTVRVSGDIDASNAAGRGGEIEVLGGRVALEGATLDASGSTRGGTIHVGGDFQGKGDRLASAITFVDAGSTLRVDATRSGTAGRAIVWSDGATGFYGHVSAKGARKGGFSEVSGKEYLDFRGTFDLRGALGNGTLLLDPKNIQILANGTAGTSTNPADFSDFTVNAGATSTIDADVLTNWLNGGFGAEIILQANNDIMFMGGAIVAQNAGSDVDLNLQAGRNILFLNGSVLSLDAGNLIAATNLTGLDAANRDAGQGIFAVLNGASVTSVSGSIAVTVDPTNAGAFNPGPIAILGGFNAPTITLTSTNATKGVVAIVGDQDAVNLALGSSLTIDAGLAAVFLSNGNDAWSFDSLDVEAAQIVFDNQATGVTATGAGGLTFTSAGTGLFTQTTGAFTFTGPTTLLASYDSAGAAVFAGTVNLGGNINADGDITFQQAVALGGARTITLDDPDASGDLVDFQGAVTGNFLSSLTLNLNAGGATFQGQVGTNANAIGDIVVNNLGETLDFQADVFADSLASTGGAGRVILGGNLDLRGTTADAVNSLNILADNSQDIEVHGNITSAASVLFASATALHGGGTNTITLSNGGTLAFSNTLNADAGENLTINLNGGSASFGAGVGTTGALGNIGVNGLGGTLDFNSSVVADELVSVSGAGTVNLGDGDDLITLTGTNGNGASIEINAAQTNLGADFVLGGSVLLSGPVRLFGNGDGDVSFAFNTTDDATLTVNGPVTAQAGTALLLDFSAINAGGATFNGTVGVDDGNGGNGADTLGDILVTNLGGTLSFNGNVFANSMTSTSGAGTINLGDGDDVLTFTGANGAGNALELTASNNTINLRGDITAQLANAAVRMNSNLSVTGARTITTNNGLIDLASVLLDASAANTALALLSNGGEIRVADGAGESIRRDLGGLNQASFTATSTGGNITLGVTGDTASLSLLNADAAAGTVTYLGNRYFAEQILLTGSSHNLPDADVVFGDLAGTTSVVDQITFAGGNLQVVGGRTVSLNALDAGGNGNVSLFGARATGANAVLNLGATNLVTLGTGDTIGNGVRFGRVNVASRDVDIQNSIFADGLFLNPITDILNFGGGAGDMVVDAGEIALLNAGSIGTLFLGHDDRATFNTYAGTTNLFGGTPVNGNLEVYGNTFVTGIFNPATGRIELFGPTTLNANAGIQTSAANQGILFYSGLTTNANGTLTTNNGAVSFVNLIPGPGLQTASINAGGAGAGLTINSGTARTTLHDVGDLAALANLNISAGQIFFQGGVHNAGAQVYTSDEYRILGDISNPIAANFNGDTVLFNDALGGSVAQIRIGSGVDVNFNLTNSFTSNAHIVRNAAANDQDVVVNAANQILITTAVGVDNGGADREIGSLTLNSNLITVDDVLTQTFQTYTGGNLITLTGDRYQTLTGATIAFNGSVVLSPPAPAIVAVTTANGGTVFFNGASVNGNDNTLAVNTGANGTINFAPGISINNATQQYAAGNYNFLGSATLSSDQPIASIVFQGGNLNLQGGLLSVQTVGANADIALGSLVNLNGFNLDAFATGAGGDVTLPVLVSNGGEIVRVRANGAATLAGIQNVGVQSLDLRSNTLAINGATLADNVLIRAFDANRGISVGQNAANTLNISNATLANLQPVAGGINLLQIGESGYAGQITIDNATLNRNATFIADGANGRIRIQGGGLNGFGGFSTLNLTGSEIQLGALVQSNAGALAANFNGPTNIFGNASVRSQGGDVAFAGPISGLVNGQGNLEVLSSGGRIILPATAIGQTRALGSLTLAGPQVLDFNLFGANTTGNQLYVTGVGGRMLLQPDAVFAAGPGASITFTGDATALGNLLVQVAGGGAGNAIVFSNDLVGTGAAGQLVTLNAGQNGSVSLASLGLPGAELGSANIAGGVITLGGDARLLGDLTLTAPQMFITGDRVLSASTMNLTGDLDSQGNAASLTLEDAIATLINGRLGGNSPLASFTSSDAGTTTLQGGIFANGRVLFRNNVLVQGPMTVQSFGDTAADGIRFLGTIDGSAANTGELTLIVDRSKGLLINDPVAGGLRPDGNIPLIELFGSVGVTNALSTLAFNFGQDVNGAAVDGRDFVPANATIILGDRDAFLADGTRTNFTLNTDRLLMGAREKLLTLGSLKASGSVARLSDMAALDDLLVGFGSVEILLRESGTIFDPTTLLTAEDVATDFVAGGNIDFGTITVLTPLVDGAAAPEFSLPGGDPTVLSNAGFFLFKALDEDVANLINSNGILLDPRADGPSNTNVAEALAGATPRQSQAEAVAVDSSLSQSTVDALASLNIAIKTPADGGYLLDLLETGQPIVDTASVARVSQRRLERDLLQNLADQYNETFLIREVNAAGETVVVDTRRDEIRGVLQEAVAAYTPADGDITADGLLAFLRQGGETQAQAMSEIDRLRQIVAGARNLGLTEREILSVKSALIGQSRPENLTSSVFGDLIEPDQAVLLGVR
jgi:filamentous hemagglutinin family protein